MKKVIVLLIFILISLAEGQESSVKIFMLKDPSLNVEKAMKMDINRLELEDIPWLTNDDIQFYDYSTHCIYLKADADKFFRRPLKPFVVIANTKRCYIGSFWSVISSMSPKTPYIVVRYKNSEVSKIGYPKDIIHISESWSDSIDVRSDDSLKAALKSLNLFHGGITLELKSVNIVDNSDTATIECTYAVTNNGKENLLVIDPEKISSTVFHYFTNGVRFWFFEYHNYVKYKLKYKNKLKPFVDYDTSWFTAIQPNEKIERIVKLRGYPKIKSGTYRCDFTFSNPDADREGRYLSNGRIWIGGVVSNIIEVEVR